MASRSVSRLFRHSATPYRGIHRSIVAHVSKIQPQLYLRNAATRSFAVSSRRFKDDSHSTPAGNTSSQQIPSSDVDLLKSLPPENPDQPSYALIFTCKSCTHRSAHRISKQGYHHGSVLVQCPGCKNRHLIADHLKVFGDKTVTLEQILAENGDLLKKGGFGVDGDLEMWEEKDEGEIKAIG